MVTVSDSSILHAVIDAVGFILISIGYILRALLKAILPQTYRKNCAQEIALITGAGSGIGRLVAIRLAELGATIVIWDINEAGIEETVKLIKAIGGNAHGFKCNIADREEVYRVAKQVEEKVGDVTMLINNAGVASTDFILNTPDHLIQRTFDVNVLAHFWTTKAFLPKMIEKDHGHIVTIASMAGFVGMRKLVDYCASKHAAVGFDEALRVELRTQGIRNVKTLCICPYFIQSTGMFVNVFSRFLPRLKSQQVADRIVLGIQREEILVMMPSILRYMYFMKWIVPWEVISMVLRNMVTDWSGDEGSQQTDAKQSNNDMKKNASIQDRVSVIE